MFERELRTLSFVPRWVITRNIKTQSVAEHSFYVAVYADQIARFIGARCDRGELLHAALWHDAEECFTGDIPGPSKRNMIHDQELYQKWIIEELKGRFKDQIPYINEETRQILKIANLIDEVLYKATEINMGNADATYSFGLSFDRLVMALKDLPFGKELGHLIHRSIQEHTRGNDKLPENNSDLAPRH